MASAGVPRPGDLEKAHPWSEDRFSQPEPQERRGAPGSRDVGGQGENRPRRGRAATPQDASGVNPLGPIDPAMPYLKPGDQGG